MHLQIMLLFCALILYLTSYTYIYAHLSSHTPCTLYLRPMLASLEPDSCAWITVQLTRLLFSRNPMHTATCTPNSTIEAPPPPHNHFVCTSLSIMTSYSLQSVTSGAMGGIQQCQCFQMVSDVQWVLAMEPPLTLGQSGSWVHVGLDGSPCKFHGPRFKRFLKNWN